MISCAFLSVSDIQFASLTHTPALAQRRHLPTLPVLLSTPPHLFPFLCFLPSPFLHPSPLPTLTKNKQKFWSSDMCSEYSVFIMDKSHILCFWLFRSVDHVDDTVTVTSARPWGPPTTAWRGDNHSRSHSADGQLQHRQDGCQRTRSLSLFLSPSLSLSQWRGRPCHPACFVETCDWFF